MWVSSCFPFLSVYGRHLWDELAGLHSWWDLHWCIKETSMSCALLVRDWVRPVTVQLFWSFMISFRSRGYGYSSSGQFFYLV